MPLTVLSIAFSCAPVAPETAGGAEQILGALDDALVAAGNTSLVAACEGSRPAGKLFSAPLPQTGELDAAATSWRKRSFQAAIDRALSSTHVDLIHMHGLDFHEYTVPATLPTLVTLHMPIAWYPPATWRRHKSRTYFCCVSESQRRSCSLDPRHADLQACAVIENGVALPPPRTHQAAEEFAVVMGRVCPEKNAHAALEAGFLARTPVLLAGQVFPYKAHRHYMNTRIEPLLQAFQEGVKHEFLGPLPSPQRQDLLARAKCLLHPTLAPETSSLVAMEALAAGTPVIAYPSGALPEIIEDGVTGFLVGSVDEMARAIAKVKTLSRQACRAAAEKRFGRDRMVRAYFALYATLLGRRTSARRYA